MNTLATIFTFILVFHVATSAPQPGFFDRISKSVATSTKTLQSGMSEVTSAVKEVATDVKEVTTGAANGVVHSANVFEDSTKTAIDIVFNNPSDKPTSKKRIVNRTVAKKASSTTGKAYTSPKPKSASASVTPLRKDSQTSQTNKDANSANKNAVRVKENLADKKVTKSKEPEKDSKSTDSKKSTELKNGDSQAKESTTNDSTANGEIDQMNQESNAVTESKNAAEVRTDDAGDDAAAADDVEVDDAAGEDFAGDGATGDDAASDAAASDAAAAADDSAAASDAAAADDSAAASDTADTVNDESSKSDTMTEAGDDSSSANDDSSTHFLTYPVFVVKATSADKLTKLDFSKIISQFTEPKTLAQFTQSL